MTTTRKIRRKTRLTQQKTADRSGDNRIMRALECLRRAAGIGRRAI